MTLTFKNHPTLILPLDAATFCRRTRITFVLLTLFSVNPRGNWNAFSVRAMLLGIRSCYSVNIFNNNQDDNHISKI